VGGNGIPWYCICSDDFNPVRSYSCEQPWQTKLIEERALKTEQMGHQYVLIHGMFKHLIIASVLLLGCSKPETQDDILVYKSEELNERLTKSFGESIEAAHLLSMSLAHCTFVLPNDLSGSCTLNGSYSYDNKLFSIRTELGDVPSPEILSAWNDIEIKDSQVLYRAHRGYDKSHFDELNSQYRFASFLISSALKEVEREKDIAKEWASNSDNIKENTH
jgi:hypothetical protein